MGVQTILYTNALSLDLADVWVNDDIYCALLADTYTPNQDAHDFLDDVDLGTHEVSGSGYTANGVLIANRSVSLVLASNRRRFLGDPASWNPATIAARWGLLYDRTPATDATRPLIAYVDFGGPQSSDAAEFSYTPPADGWFYMSTP